ncbi:MAG: SpoIIE family protein phosphatase [Candidatus Omnitrophota bacterium]
MRSISFKTKVALIFFTCFTILFVFLIGLFYTKAISIQKENLRQKLIELSTLGTKLISADLVENMVPVRASMKTREYMELAGKLNNIMGIHPEIADVYILVATKKPGVMKFIANGDTKEPVDCGEEFDVTSYPELMKAAEWPSADRDLLADRWGLWLSGYAPIKDDKNRTVAILGIDISAETVDQMKSVVRRNAFYVFMIGIILSILASNLASWWLTKPLDKLVEGMEKIRKGDLDHKINLGTADEMGRLGENFNAMAWDLKEHIRNITDVTTEKERLNRELEIAAELQQAMLPHYKLDVKELDMASLSLPARQVGGDYFDYINKDNRNIGFVIADATGKGLPSSIFMTNSKSIFKVITTEEISPAKVIQRTNDQVIREMSASAGMFVTMFYGIYNRDTKIFHYCNAGHNPPLFIAEGSSKVRLLSTHGCPVGIIEEQEYGQDEIKLSNGDTIILYTDGVVEAMNKQREMFGLQRLLKLAIEIKDLSAQEIVDKIRATVFEFAGTQAQFDDLTLLVFRIKE